MPELAPTAQRQQMLPRIKLHDNHAVLCKLVEPRKMRHGLRISPATQTCPCGQELSSQRPPEGSPPEHIITEIKNKR